MAVQVAVAAQEVLLLEHLVLHQVVMEILHQLHPHKVMPVVMESQQALLLVWQQAAEVVQVLLEELVLMLVVLVVWE